jgi:hypothetical protein
MWPREGDINCLERPTGLDHNTRKKTPSRVPIWSENPWLSAPTWDSVTWKITRWSKEGKPNLTCKPGGCRGQVWTPKP